VTEQYIDAEAERAEMVRRWLLTLPSCPFDSRRYLPHISAIYFLMRENDCLYVGLTTDLQTRWGSHTKPRSAGDASALRIAWVPIGEGPAESRYLEYRLICLLRPSLNTESIDAALNYIQVKGPKLRFRLGQTWAQSLGLAGKRPKKGRVK
jgi:GIY-YIG catalytic domain-containing protein